MITKLRSQNLRRLSTLPHSEDGVTLVEAIVSTIIFSLAMFTVVPTLTQFQLQAATNENRVNAISVSQQVLDAIRLSDVEELPSSGTHTTLPDGTSTSNILYRGKYYSGTTTFCQNNSLCDTKSRQIIVTVSQNGKSLYTVETLYTKFE